MCLFVKQLLLSVICVTMYATVQAKRAGVDMTVTHKVRFVVHHGDTKLGSIFIDLYGKIAPKTVRNFITFAGRGFWGLTYANTSFHRVNNYLIQGGDVENQYGWGSLSIYGKYFDDEPFILNHTEPGIVSVANNGVNTNGAQFFILTKKASWLDGKHVVFAKVSKGLDVVHKIQEVPVNSRNTPTTAVVITNSSMKELHQLNDDISKIKFDFSDYTQGKS